MQNQMQDQTQPTKYFIRDCNGSICGNKTGYLTVEGANRCINNPNHKAYRQVWAAFDNRMDKTANLICKVEPAGQF